MNGDSHQPRTEVKDAIHIAREGEQIPPARRGRLRPSYEPTTEEIAAACASIRGAWTEQERIRRGRLIDS